jgi:23S rRNA pseudouridine955/2504/2580 synthase
MPSSHWRVRFADDAQEYTLQTVVETMPYVEDPLPEQERAEIRTQVQHLTVTAEEAGQRLDNFIHKRLGGMPRSRIYRVIRKGEVRVNGRRAGPEQRLAAEDRIRIPPVRLPVPGEPARPAARLLKRIEAAIIREEPRLLVLDKPAGVAVHGGSGVSSGVIEALRALKPGESLELVHRLDRDTSGVLLVARNTATLRTLHALLREEGFEKRYLALLAGKWNLGEKRIDVPLRTDTRVGGERTVRADPSGKASVSRFRPVQFFGRTATLVEVEIDTGRRGLQREAAGAWLDAHVPARLEPEFPMARGWGVQRQHTAPGRPRGGARAARGRSQGAGYGRAQPALRSAPASQMSGNPMRPVGSRLSMHSNRVIPSASALKPPAQSKGRSTST